MRPYWGVILLSSSAIGAPSGNPSDAFECNLPYRSSLETAAKLKVSKQSSTPASTFFGAKTTIEFAPGETKIWGQKPTHLAFEMVEKKKGYINQENIAKFSAAFLRTQAVDKIFRSATAWNACREDQLSCARSAKASGDGRLAYSRQSPTNLVITCTFSVREEDLAP